MYSTTCSVATCRRFGLMAVLAITAVAAMVVFAAPGIVAAQQPQGVRSPSPAPAQPMSLAQAERPKSEQTAVKTAERTVETTSTGEDEVAERQSIDTWSSIEDGQPGAPGELEIHLASGWQTRSGEHDPVFLHPELEYTLDGSEFLRNTQLLLGVPLTLGFGDYAGEGDIEFGWQQRWVKEEGLMPTLATLAEMRIPSGYEGSGVDGKFTGIVDKDIGPGTAYLNAFIITANGHEVDDLRHFQWGARAGYKWRITDALALLVDYVHQSSEETGHANSNTLEVSSEYKVTEHFSIGPGIVIGLDRNGETPYFGAGCRFVYTIK